MDSDSDSDYVVDEFVRPDSIRKTINDESADILGNFDDSKRTEEWNTPGEGDAKENGHMEMPSHSSAQQAIDQQSSEDEDDGESDEDGGQRNLTDEQLASLLRGAKSKRHVLYVTNLNFETSKDDLEVHFALAGEVKSTRIPPKRRGGFGFVEMLTTEGLKRGLDLHNSELQGRKIKVQISEGGKKKSANKKNILKQKNRKLAEMRKETKSFTKSGKNYDKSIKKEKMKEALLRKRWRKPKKLGQ